MTNCKYGVDDLKPTTPKFSPEGRGCRTAGALLLVVHVHILGVDDFAFLLGIPARVC
jgi:hypothetical protein